MALLVYLFSSVKVFLFSWYVLRKYVHLVLKAVQHLTVLALFEWKTYTERGKDYRG